VVLALGSTALAQQSGRVDWSNIGVATEDAVISSGLPDANLDLRQFNDFVDQQLMNTASPEYPSPAAGAAAQEYMIFKFDFSSLPQGAAATDGSFDFCAWSTQGEGTEDEAIYGRFKLFEITGGDSAWTDGWVSEGVENPNPVTWNSLNGTFVELTEITEDNTDPPDNSTGNPFGPLYPGLLVSNGGFDGPNRVVDVPAETIDRLISGQSIGLAIGSVSPEPAPLGGDFNGDGYVDGVDLLAWQRELGNVVDAADLGSWIEGFGASSTVSEGTTNFTILTTESFLSPLSAATLNFDWAQPTPSNRVVPEPTIGSILLVLAMAAATPWGRSG
jgi:hypothetical protein